MHAGLVLALQRNVALEQHAAWSVHVVEQQASSSVERQLVWDESALAPAGLHDSESGRRASLSAPAIAPAREPAPRFDPPAPALAATLAAALAAEVPAPPDPLDDEAVPAAEPEVRDLLRAPHRPRPAAPAPAALAPGAPVAALSGAADGPSAAVSVVAPQPAGDNPPPEYPIDARRAGEEGLVLVRASLDERGALLDARVVSSSGFERLDAAALAAVRGWRFLPARAGEQAVAGVLDMPIRFSLRRG